MRSFACALVILALAPSLSWATSFEAELARIVRAIESDPYLQRYDPKGSELARLPQSPEERARVIEALGPILKEGAGEPSDRRLQAQLLAIDVLAAFGKEAHPALVDALSSSSLLVHLEAGRHLTAAGPAAIPVILDAVRERGRRRYARCDQVLGDMGPAALGSLSAAMQDPSAEVRYCAVLALGDLGAPALPVLAQVLESDGDPQVRFGASLSLGRLGAPEGERFTILAAAWRRESEVGVRARIASDMLGLGDHADGTLPLLIEGYRSGGAQQGFYAWGLESLGTHLRARGDLRWGTPARVYPFQTLFLAVFLLTWYGWSLRRGAKDRALLRAVVVAAVPAVVVGGAGFFVFTRTWAHAYLPTVLEIPPELLALECATPAGLAGYLAARYRRPSAGRGSPEPGGSSHSPDG